MEKKYLLQGEKIGIWGLGIVGKAAVNYFHKYGNPIEVMDKRTLTLKEQQWLQKLNITFLKQKNIKSFLKRNDLILASPGIDLRPYNQMKNKCISELDIISNEIKKPIIAVTGSVGKTTITHILSHLLTNHGLRTLTGGNIGTCMLDLLEKQEEAEMLLLELSSFQLEQCKMFAPDLAIWTNFYPNHLDRHNNLKDYFNAKQNIIAQQSKKQQALLPLAIIKKINRLRHNQTCSFFSQKPPNLQEKKYLKKQDSLFFIDNNEIVVLENNVPIPLISLDKIPTLSFKENWLIICSTLYLLGIPLDDLNNATKKTKLPSYRLEKIRTINDIDFYNDSKSTTSASTLAAVMALQNKPLLLLLGGQSKGIDREPLIKKIKNKVKIVCCFGQEHKQLLHLCKKYNIQSYGFATLEQAFKKCVDQASPGDQIVFSPAGASFDLFANYQERGKQFNCLVKQLTSI